MFERWGKKLINIARPDRSRPRSTKKKDFFSLNLAVRWFSTLILPKSGLFHPATWWRISFDKRSISYWKNKKPRVFWRYQISKAIFIWDNLPWLKSRHIFLAFAAEETSEFFDRYRGQLPKLLKFLTDKKLWPGTVKNIH